MTVAFPMSALWIPVFIVMEMSAVCVELAMARSATVTTPEGFLATMRTSVACVDVIVI